MKKLTAVLVLLGFVLVGVFALDASVVWNWYRNDRAVKYYRYQLDGEEEDNWTVVDSSVLEVSLDVDVSEVHVLYLQQSYDGIHWSESSCTESEIYEDSGYSEEDDFYYDEINDDFEDFEDLPEEVVEEPTPEEAPVEETPVEAPKEDSSRSYFNFALSYRNSIPNGTVSKTAGFVISFTHLFPFESEFSSGFRVENGYYTTDSIFQGLSKTDYFITLSLMGVMSFAPNKGDFTIGFGPEVQLQVGLTDPTFHYGLNSLLGLRYKISDKISLALSASDHFFFYPKKINAYSVRAAISLDV